MDRCVGAAFAGKKEAAAEADTPVIDGVLGAEYEATGDPPMSETMDKIFRTKKHSLEAIVNVNEPVYR